MAARWDRLDPRRIADVAESMASLHWPVRQELLPAVLAGFGWRQVRAGVPAYYTGFGITPDLGTTTCVDGHLTTLSAYLVDREPVASQEFSNWLLQVSGEYVLALKDRFGQSRVNRFPNDRLVSAWEMESGCVLSLVTSASTIKLKVESPRMAAARRGIAGPSDR